MKKDQPVIPSALVITLPFSVYDQSGNPTTVVELRLVDGDFRLPLPSVTQVDVHRDWELSNKQFDALFADANEAVVESFFRHAVTIRLRA